MPSNEEVYEKGWADVAKDNQEGYTMARTQTVPRTDTAQPDQQAADTQEQARIVCPWAGMVVEVDGGWLCFESPDDYQIWINQQ